MMTATADPFASPWTMHVIAPGAQTGPFRGADGVDFAMINGMPAVTSAWEQGGIVSLSLQQSDRSWQTLTIATTMYGDEDAEFADFDGDGRLDIVISRDGDQRVHVAFQPPIITDKWQVVLLPASMGHGHVMQALGADVNGDGFPDVVMGSRVGTATNPAVIAWLQNPGAGAASRDGTAWTFHLMDIAGDTMRLMARDVDGDGDVDVLLSDRTYYTDPSGVRKYDRVGARWLRNEGKGASWTNVTIWNTPANTGEAHMFGVGDFNGDGIDDVVSGSTTGTFSAPLSHMVIATNPGAWTGTWPVTKIPDGTNVGQFQDGQIADIDGDGRMDLVIACTEDNNYVAGSTREGVYWLQNTTGGWVQHPIAGAPGTKYDNSIVRDMDGDGDLDVLQSEQVDQLGVIWYENPRAAQ